LCILRHGTRDIPLREICASFGVSILINDFLDKTDIMDSSGMPILRILRPINKTHICESYIQERRRNTFKRAKYLLYYMNTLADYFTTITPRVTMWEQASGLMFRKQLVDEAYVFIFQHERKIPLHMLFVFQKIDILWINEDYEIIDLKKNVKPFTLAVYHKGRAKYVVEMPAGSIDDCGFKLMDSLKV